MPVVKVLLIRIRHERRLHRLRPQRLPVEVLEPGMEFHLVDALHAEPLVRFALQTPVDEVCCFLRVALGQILLTDVSLLIPDRVSDGLPVGAEVRSPPHDALVTDHANSEIISRYRIILFEHYLRGHVARCAGVVRAVLGLPDSRNAKVS